MDDQILLHTDEYEIQWEIGPFKKELTDKGHANLLPMYLDIFKRADGILKQYIRIKKGQKFTLKELPKSKTLGAFKRSVTFPECHLVIIVALVGLAEGTIAQAR